MLFNSLAIPGFLVAVMALIRALPRLRGTTLLAAWGAAALTLAAWVGSWVLTHVMETIADSSAAGHLWYGVAVLALCPPVAVLGARRPVSHAWPWFVLLPLVSVFSIPSLTVIWRDGTSSPLQLETPMLLGLVLVLVMGVGNYVSTRHTLPALLYGTAVALLILPATQFGPPCGWSPGDCRTAGTLCFGLAAAAVIWTTRDNRESARGSECVWRDFRDTFGLVWAKRVMERVNWSAREENWSATLDLAGLNWATGDLSDEDRRHTRDRLEQTFRWLLKRFVDDRWLEARLDSGEQEPHFSG